MNYLENYNNYVEYVKSQVALGLRPKSKYDYSKNFKSSYFEFHHIIPRCLGGTNDKSNIIPLTAREHYLAHYLLSKINPNNEGLKFAFYIMSKSNNSRLYEKVKSEIDFGKVWRGKKLDEAYRKKISENHADISGDKNPMFGKHHSDASKRKMSQSKKEFFESHPEQREKLREFAKKNFVGGGNPRAKKVRCVENGMIFSTTAEAAVWCGLSKNSKTMISNCCKNKSKTVNGYHFEYY